MKSKFFEEYRVKNYAYEEEKKKIIKNNNSKTVYEIKKIIKKIYPDITNKEMIELITKMNKTRTIENLKKVNKKEENER